VDCAPWQCRSPRRGADPAQILGDHEDLVSDRDNGLLFAAPAHDLTVEADK
jgi:hypothetical protein